MLTRALVTACFTVAVIGIMAAVDYWTKKEKSTAPGAAPRRGSLLERSGLGIGAPFRLKKDPLEIRGRRPPLAVGRMPRPEVSSRVVLPHGSTRPVPLIDVHRR
jgi:hypothetical protein